MFIDLLIYQKFKLYNQPKFKYLNYLTRMDLRIDFSHIFSLFSKHKCTNKQPKQKINWGTSSMDFEFSKTGQWG